MPCIPLSKKENGDRYTNTILAQLLIILQAKAATLTIAQGFSIAYQSWQAAQVPARRGREVDKVGGQEADKKGNVVVTEAVVEKQPDDADEPVTSSSAGDLCCGHQIRTKTICKEYQHQVNSQRTF